MIRWKWEQHVEKGTRPPESAGPWIAAAARDAFNKLLPDRAEGWEEVPPTWFPPWAFIDRKRPMWGS